MGLLLQLAFFAAAAVGVWVCGRALLEIDHRYADVPLPTPQTPTIAVRATTPVVVPDTAPATAPAPIPPPSMEPEPAALVA